MAKRPLAPPLCARARRVRQRVPGEVIRRFRGAPSPAVAPRRGRAMAQERVRTSRAGGGRSGRVRGDRRPHPHRLCRDPRRDVPGVGAQPVLAPRRRGLQRRRQATAGRGEPVHAAAAAAAAGRDGFRFRRRAGSARRDGRRGGDGARAGGDGAGRDGASAEHGTRGDCEIFGGGESRGERPRRGRGRGRGPGRGNPLVEFFRTMFVQDPGDGGDGLARRIDRDVVDEAFDPG